MIEFNLDDFWDKVPQIMKGSNYKPIIDYGIKNNHNTITYLYRQTEHYKKKSNETEEILTRGIGNRNRYVHLEWMQSLFTKIQEYGIDVLDEGLFHEVSLRWADYILAEGKTYGDNFYRFGPNHLTHKDGLEVLNKLYEKYNKCLISDYPEELHFQNICAGLWTLCDANKPEDILTIGNYYLDLVRDRDSFIYEIFISETRRGTFDNPYRSEMSLSWPVAQTLKHIGRFEDAKEIYRNLKRNFDTGHVNWQPGINRALEAGVELYKLEPTEENKQWCFNVIHTLSGYTIENNLEALNEIFLVFYMIYKHIYNRDV